MKTLIAITIGACSLAALAVASVVLPFMEAWGMERGIVQRGQGR